MLHKKDVFYCILVAFQTLLALVDDKEFLKGIGCFLKNAYFKGRVHYRDFKITRQKVFQNVDFCDIDYDFEVTLLHRAFD